VNAAVRNAKDAKLRKLFNMISPCPMGDE